MLKDNLEDSNADRLNALIDETINDLCDGNSEMAANGLVELARFYSKAGMPQDAFEHMRKVIIGSAINKTGEPGFIKSKLEEAEHWLAEKRKAHKIDNIVRH